jgi:predicted metal-dependent phosphoesterase TrpH
MTMKADLHIHTWFSTGTQTPEEVIQEADSKGIGLISITDDDTMDAYQGLADIAGQYGVSFIKGVQVSATIQNSLFRLLAYDCDPNNLRLQNLLQENRTIWDDVGLQIMKVLEKEYPELSAEEFINYQKDPKHGGFKHNSYLYHKGLDGSDKAVTKLFMQHKEEMLEIMSSLAFRPVEEVIGIIHDAGGYAIVPGGYLRNPDTLTEDVDNLVAAGLDGLEVFSPSYSAEVATTLREYANAHQLLITGGGDGHGTWISQEKLGIGIVEIDDQALNLGTIRIY